MNKTFVGRAHGRVNLIGEHTDYNSGWVLPTAIAQFTEISLIRRSDNKVILTSTTDPKVGAEREFTYELGSEAPTHTWVDYLLGGTNILKESLSQGFFVSITSNIPEGSGLSSSAALEISFLKALREAFELALTDIEIAQIGQKIENEFVGARVGIMDQMATCLAKRGEALFLDTRNLTYENITLPLDQMDILILNSGLTHRLSEGDGGYNARRKQCEEASSLLGVKALRDISLQELSKRNLPDLLMRRARHVVSENERVHAAVKAIKDLNLELLGKLMDESHESMKNDYEVSIPEIDLLVNLCRKDPRVFGARLTGGGFGGSIVAITKKGSSKFIGEVVLEKYQKNTGLTGALLS
jgi:galactokinase